MDFMQHLPVSIYFFLFRIFITKRLFLSPKAMNLLPLLSGAVLFYSSGVRKHDDKYSTRTLCCDVVRGG